MRCVPPHLNGAIPRGSADGYADPVAATVAANKDGLVVQPRPKTLQAEIHFCLEQVANTI
jgi:hypothetical protein